MEKGFTYSYRSPGALRNRASYTRLNYFHPPTLMSILPYAKALFCGLGVFLLLVLWKKSASRWSTWFPVLRKTLQFVLVIAVIGVFVAALADLADSHGLSSFKILSFVLGIVSPWLVAKPRMKTQETVKRGSVVANSDTVAKLVKKQKKRSDITLAGVPIPVDSEPYHYLAVGSTGVGKSVAISTFIRTAKERGDTLIIVDSGGNFLQGHFDPETDFVFNPYDSRCVGWSPTAEMQGAWDAQALARSIVPDGTGESKEWNAYTQTFVSSVLRRLWEKKQLSLAHFLYAIQVAPLEELRELLAGTPAASQLEAEKTFGAIRTIASSYLNAYEYLPTNRPVFSVTQMIRAEHSGALFLTYREDQLDSVRSMLACLLDVVARTVLSLSPDPDRRVWLIIDEFASIGKIQSIEQVATKARKNGGCLVVGIQSVSQLQERYGEHGAQTILSCLSTWLVLRCSDTETAEYMSKYVGEVEVLRSQQGLSQSDSGQTESLQEQTTTQRAVLPSQLQALPALQGFLKLAGSYPICNVKLEIPKSPTQRSVEAFSQRDFSLEPLLDLKLAPAALPASESNAPLNVEQKSKEEPTSPIVLPARQTLRSDIESMQNLSRLDTIDELNSGSAWTLSASEEHFSPALIDAPPLQARKTENLPSTKASSVDESSSETDESPNLLFVPVDTTAKIIELPSSVRRKKLREAAGAVAKKPAQPQPRKSPKPKSRGVPDDVKDLFR